MRRNRFLVLAVLLASIAFAAPAFAQAEGGGDASGGQMTLADYEQAQDTGGYNSDYLFALSRGLGDSPMHAAAKAPLFIFTVPLDIVLLPFAAIGGIFG